MEIIIQGKASAYIEKANRLRWKLHSKKLILFSLTTLVVGIVFFIDGLEEDYNSSISNAKFVNNSNITYTHIIQYNYHFFSGLGICCFLIFLYVTLILFFVQKRKFFKKVKETVKRYELYPVDTFTLKITDENLFYQDNEIVRQEKWIVFSKYKIYEEYLFLFRDDFSVSALVIDKKQIKDADFSILLKFIIRRMPEA